MPTLEVQDQLIAMHGYELSKTKLKKKTRRITVEINNITRYIVWGDYEVFNKTYNVTLTFFWRVMWRLCEQVVRLAPGLNLPQLHLSRV